MLRSFVGPAAVGGEVVRCGAVEAAGVLFKAAAEPSDTGLSDGVGLTSDTSVACLTTLLPGARISSDGLESPPRGAEAAEALAAAIVAAAAPLFALAFACACARLWNSGRAGFR